MRERNEGALALLLNEKRLQCIIPLWTRYSGVVPVTHCDCEKGCSDFLFRYEKEAKNQPKDNRAHNTQTVSEIDQRLTLVSASVLFSDQ